ncbi:MAG: prolipoprotein diacylglyceryl transferase [Kofleriaceae bacterium]|nr:prolipoprotein diacylglyceryl transferase [Kofleriaceae bacterium]
MCRSRQLPAARLGDLAVVPPALALCTARLGCFLAGCDYGKVTDAATALRFPAGSPAWRDHVRAGLVPPERVESLPVHPTQLWRGRPSACLIAAGGLRLARPPRGARPPAAASSSPAAAAYAAGCLRVEELRGDAGRGFQLGLSSGQVFALVLPRGDRRRPDHRAAARAGDDRRAGAGGRRHGGGADPDVRPARADP